MVNYLIVPGLGGSGEKHWQTWLENTQSNFRRIEQRNWDEPDMDTWVETLNTVVSGYDEQTVVLVAHSLGCLTVSEWFRRYGKKVKGAMLVAPPEVPLVHKALNRRLFDQNPVVGLSFPSVVVASTTDQWSAIENIQQYADAWGSYFVNIGAAGHINADSGHYEWKQGLEIIKSMF